MIDNAVDAPNTSGEINREIADPPRCSRPTTAFTHAHSIDHTDGLSIALAEWRFNLACPIPSRWCG
ncbi:MAG: hypothetical protein U5K56_19220 [Halioglobus sp.]|nr:hypothetical protein [Halioglobus sp.]